MVTSLHQRDIRIKKRDKNEWRRRTLERGWSHFSPGGEWWLVHFLKVDGLGVRHNIDHRGCNRPQTGYPMCGCRDIAQEEAVRGCDIVFYGYFEFLSREWTSLQRNVVMRSIEFLRSTTFLCLKITSLYVIFGNSVKWNISVTDMISIEKMLVVVSERIEYWSFKRTY